MPGKLTWIRNGRNQKEEKIGAKLAVLKRREKKRQKNFWVTVRSGKSAADKYLPRKHVK